MTTSLILPITRGVDLVGVLTFTEPVANFDQIWLTIRTDYATTQTDDTTAILQVELGDGIAATGTYTASLEISDTDTLLLTARNYVFDIKVRSLATGKIYQSARGSVKMSPDVTRSTS